MITSNMPSILCHTSAGIGAGREAEAVWTDPSLNVMLMRLLKCTTNAAADSIKTRPSLDPTFPLECDTSSNTCFCLIIMCSQQTQQSNIVMIVVTVDHGLLARITSRNPASSAGESKDTCISCSDIKRMRIHSNGAE